MLLLGRKPGQQVFLDKGNVHVIVSAVRRVDALHVILVDGMRLSLKRDERHTTSVDGVLIDIINCGYSGESLNIGFHGPKTVHISRGEP